MPTRTPRGVALDYRGQVGDVVHIWVRRPPGMQEPTGFQPFVIIAHPPDGGCIVRHAGVCDPDEREAYAEQLELDLGDGLELRIRR